MNPMSNISQELREQIINIIDDLVDRITPGYLPPNSFSLFDYKKAIYEGVCKSVWDELGMRCVEKLNYREALFDLLRDVPSEKFFDVIEYVLKMVHEKVYMQITIPDNIILHPSAGNKLWSRKESVRDRHISLFKGAVDKLNHRLSQHSTKYRYKLSGESVQMVRVDTGLDVPKEENGIEKKGDNQPPERQKKNNNQPPEHHQNQNRSEFWNKKHYVIAVIVGGATFLELAFGDGILIPLFSSLWNYLKTFL